MMQENQINETNNQENSYSGNYSENNSDNNTNATTDNSTQNIKNKPKLIISSYKISPKMVEAGKDFELSLSLYNTNNENGIYNLKVSLDQQGQSIGTSQGQENTTVTDGSVFSPVGRSNTFYRSAIYPWNYTSETLTMNVLPNAKAGNYLMNIHFEYEDYLGNQYQTTETIGIPVVQTAAISTSDINIDEIFEGEAANVSINLYNTGKDNLTNFMCKVEGEGFSVDEDSHFVGNFAQGATDSYSFNITAQKAGVLKGKIIISYEDSTGEKHQEEKKFSKEVNQAQAIDENMSEEMAENPNQSFVSSPILWTGILALILLAIFIIRRKRKKNKQKELEINED